MLYNLKDVSFLLASATSFVEIGATTDLRYYITNALGELDMSSLEYKLDMLKGRDATSIIGWTNVDISAVVDSIYSFPITLDDTISSTSQLKLTIKVTESDGSETFYEDSEVKAV